MSENNNNTIWYLLICVLLFNIWLAVVLKDGGGGRAPDIDWDTAIHNARIMLFEKTSINGTMAQFPIPMGWLAIAGGTFYLIMQRSIFGWVFVLFSGWYGITFRNPIGWTIFTLGAVCFVMGKIVFPILEWWETREPKKKPKKSKRAAGA